MDDSVLAADERVDEVIEVELAVSDEPTDEPTDEPRGAASDETPAEEAAAAEEVVAEGDAAEVEAELADDAAERVDPWTEGQTRGAVEALLFASPEPLPFRAIRRIIPEDAVTTQVLRAALDVLVERYDREDSGVMLTQIAGGWQFQTREPYFAWVRSLARTRSEEKITAAGLETLSIIAYKQPVTRAEIDAVRGVGSGSLIRTLMDKKMVKVVGREDVPGRPFQYGTTKHFLDHFGLGSLDDLPKGRI